MLAPNVMTRRSAGLSLVLGLLFAGSLAASQEQRLRIELDRDAKVAEFFVVGLGADELAAARELVAADGRIQDAFAVYVGDGPAPERPPMLGRYSVEERGLVFRPRFGLEPGLTYWAEFRPAAVGGRAAPVRREFMMPERPPSEPARVTHVYPSRDRLPENQLKFYLHFSAPMSQGDSYRHIHLLEQGGREVELPFLELGEELWDATGMRLTVFFDPGRIKRGLKPREEVGPALEEGKRYVLTIDGDWLDAQGRPLAESFHKRFAVGAPDDDQPDPQRWKITAPPTRTREPLVIRFGEPLDHAMLHRVLRIRDERGEPIRGRVEVDQEESRWRFRPERPWSGGTYSLVVATNLEDLAGNSIGRPFEVDVFGPIERSVQTRDVTIPFTAVGE